MSLTMIFPGDAQLGHTVCSTNKLSDRVFCLSYERQNKVGNSGKERKTIRWLFSNSDDDDVEPGFFPDLGLRDQVLVHVYLF